MDLETLKGMTLKELKKKAILKGVTRDTVDKLDDKRDPKQAAIELILAKAQEMDPESLNGMTLKELKKKALFVGVSRDAVNDLDDKQDPKQAAIELILAKIQKIDIETLEGLTLKQLKEKALVVGVSRDTVDDLDDKQDPKQAAIQLILAKVDVAIPSAKNSNLRRQAFLAGAIQQEVDDALDQPSMRRALTGLIISKQVDFIDPVGFVDPVGFWEYEGDDHKFLPYTRDESLQLDVARNREASEFGMIVGRSRLQVMMSFQRNEDGIIKHGAQKNIATGRTCNIRREASAWELVQTARSVMEKCLQELPDVGVSKYKKPDSILEILRRETEPVKLLRGSSVTECIGTEGQSRGLQRRQDLEQIFPTAFLPPVEVRTCTTASNVDASINIVSISYCWRAWDHPDADGKQLQVIRNKLQKYKNCSKFPKYDFKDLGIFWDFSSLHQKNKDGHRTNKEWSQFNEALSSMDIWYMHALIVTFIVNGQWLRELGIVYEDRGWTHFERSCAELIKPANAGGAITGHRMIEEFGESRRKLPLSPELFAEELAQRRFTSRGDKENVVTLYTKASMLALRGTVLISLEGIQLKRDDCKKIVSMLQLCASVKVLQLNSMGMDDAGAVTIAEVLPRMRRLEKLYLQENGIGDDGANAIAEILPRMQNLERLYLNGNKIGDDAAKAVAEVLPRVQKLEVLYLNVNKMGDDGAKAIAEVLRRGSSLQALFIEGNQLTEFGKCALRQACSNTGLSCFC